MDDMTYAFGNLTFSAFPLKPSVPREYLKGNTIISTLTDEQLATIAKEIYDNVVGDCTKYLADWLNEITKLPGYHTGTYAQWAVSREIIRRYINSTEYSEDY